LFFTPQAQAAQVLQRPGQDGLGQRRDGGAPQVDQHGLRRDVPRLREQRLDGRQEAVEVAGALALQGDEILIADVPDHVPGRRFHGAPSRRPS
jgi:hypothetical protein